MISFNEMKPFTHLHDIHTGRLSHRRTCTCTSWRCSGSQTRPCPVRGLLPPTGSETKLLTTAIWRKGILITPSHILQCTHTLFAPFHTADGQIWPVRLYTQPIIKQSWLLLFCFVFFPSPHIQYIYVWESKPKWLFQRSVWNFIFNNTFSFFHAERTMHVLIKLF